jgi:hypothetical protein
MKFKLYIIIIIIIIIIFTPYHNISQLLLQNHVSLTKMVMQWLFLTCVKAG